MKYKEIKAKFKEINLGVVRSSIDTYQVYWLSGIQKDTVLANVYSLESLERLLKLNI